MACDLWPVQMTFNARYGPKASLSIHENYMLFMKIKIKCVFRIAFFFVLLLLIRLNLFVVFLKVIFVVPADDSRAITPKVSDFYPPIMPVFFKAIV